MSKIKIAILVASHLGYADMKRLYHGFHDHWLV